MTAATARAPQHLTAMQQHLEKGKTGHLKCRFAFRTLSPLITIVVMLRHISMVSTS
jgi:hypothetical protein